MWYIVAWSVISLLAGIGVKWAVDRIWPPASPVRGLVDELLVRKEQEARRRDLMFEDTMDVLTSGYGAGVDTARHRRPEPAPMPEREPWINHTLEGHNWQPGVAHPGGGWLSGPMRDPHFQGEMTGPIVPQNGADQS